MSSLTESPRMSGCKLAAALLLLPGTLGLQHSAMWSLNSAVDGKGWATLTFDVGNVTDIANNFKDGIRALYAISWTTSQPEKCFAPVKHTQTTPDGYFGCIMMDPKWETTWAATLKEIQPLIDQGAIIGIFLGDEHLYFGVELADVKKIADKIRSDFPKAIVYMNEAPDVAMCGYRKDNTTIFAEDQCLPQNIDWFGYDFYHEDSSSWNDARQAYKDSVYPRMSRSDQRVVPVSLGYAQGPNVSAHTVAELDTFCAANALEFLKFGLEDSRVVGQFPFYWAGGVRNPDGSVTGNVGINDMPKCEVTYKAIGQLIIAAGAGGTTNDPVHDPPAPQASGVYPEPKCLTKIPPPPSDWSWCSRQNK